MASLIELIKLNEAGDLASLLARTFNGTTGHQYERKDSEFMIKFKSKSLTPTAEQIGEVLNTHYTSLGYTVEPVERQYKGSFEAFIFFKTKDPGSIYVSATTHYPLMLGDDHNHLRVTTKIFD